MRTRFVLIALCTLLLGFAPAPLPKKDRSRADLTDVAGSWEFLLWEYAGGRHQEYEQRFRADLTREKFDIVGGGGTYEMRLDPASSPPAFTWALGNNETHVGSYRLSRDEMTMVFVPAGGKAARPTDFSRCPAGGWRFVLRRTKRP
jgi:uncharacterized protein (TIGR03067 family)